MKGFTAKFTVTACPSPNAYTLALQRKMRRSPTVNVDRDRPKPSFERAGASLRYHNETCLIPGRRDPNPHCDSLSKM